jgi:catechol 2,3-dioxygenase-like lactoylglutathione lyase family enzyme
MGGESGRGRVSPIMIHGVHLVLYSRDAEADRAFLRDVLGFASVDAGHGWLGLYQPRHATATALHLAGR